MNSNLQKYTLQGCLLIAVLLSACVPRAVEQAQPESVTLRVVLGPFLTFAPLFIAEEEGYFPEQGLEVEFVKLDNPTAAIPALAQGELDVAGGLISIGSLNAMAKEVGVRFVGGRGYIAPTGCPFAALMASSALVEAGGLDSLTQLRGRRIEMNAVTVEGYYVEQLLTTVGLTLEDVETVDLPDPVISEALGKGTIDLASTSEPWVTRISQAGQGVIWQPVQEVIPDFQWAFIAYGPSLLEKNPDAGRRFMVAYLKGVRQLNQGKTERNVEILAKHTGLDQALVEQTCWPAFRTHGRINVQSVLDFQAWAMEKGYLDTPVTEDQFWDPSFVEYANDALEPASP